MNFTYSTFRFKQAIVIGKIAVAIAFVHLFSSCREGAPSGDSLFVRTSTGPIAVKHALGLRMDQLEDGFMIQVRNPQDTNEVMAKYRLSRNDIPSTEAYTSIRIPIQNAALNSTTFVPYFSRLDATGLISGVSYANRVTNDSLRAQYDRGQTLEIAGENGVDLERLLLTQAELLMVYIYGESSFAQVEEAGIPVVINMEYREKSPLGRAEWVKMVGALLDRYEEANALFQQIEQSYQEVKMRAAQSSYRPVVFSGSKYERMWFTPGRDSFVAQFIRDAGAAYAFEHLEGQGNNELDFESVLTTLNAADFWGMIVSSKEEFSMSQLLEIAPEYALINAFQEGQVFVCNTAKSDYFGAAVMEPDVILADLVAILHPELLPEHKATYFRPIVRDVKAKAE